MTDMAFSLFLPGSPTIALSAREDGCADAASGDLPCLLVMVCILGKGEPANVQNIQPKSISGRFQTNLSPKPRAGLSQMHTFLERVSLKWPGSISAAPTRARHWPRRS